MPRYLRQNSQFTLHVSRFFVPPQGRMPSDKARNVISCPMKWVLADSFFTRNYEILNEKLVDCSVLTIRLFILLL